MNANPTLGPVILDIIGLELTPDDIQRLQHPAVGGVILFTRNYDSYDQIQRLIQQIRALRDPPLLITIDQEGGRVQRFRQAFTRLPAAAKILRHYHQSLSQAQAASREISWLMAAELRCVGVDLSFAPVLDIDYGISQVIGDRAFGQTPQQVSELAHAWMLGAHQAGMASVGKHFPGHGAVAADSHTDQPIDERELATILLDIQPFQYLINDGLDAIMPAHIVYPQCDTQLAGFSPFWLQTLLRRQLGFQGVIFSDDLNMDATITEGDHGARAKAALQAGCDSILVCNNPNAADQILDSLDNPPISHAKLTRLYAHPWSLNRAQLEAHPRWRRAVDLVEKILQ